MQRSLLQLHITITWGTQKEKKKPGHTPNQLNLSLTVIPGIGFSLKVQGDSEVQPKMRTSAPGLASTTKCFINPKRTWVVGHEQLPECNSTRFKQGSWVPIMQLATNQVTGEW